MDLWQRIKRYLTLLGYRHSCEIDNEWAFVADWFRKWKQVWSLYCAIRRQFSVSQFELTMSTLNVIQAELVYDFVLTSGVVYTSLHHQTLLKSCWSITWSAARLLSKMEDLFRFQQLLSPVTPIGRHLVTHHLHLVGGSVALSCTQGEDGVRRQITHKVGVAGE